MECIKDCRPTLLKHWLGPGGGIRNPSTVWQQSPHPHQTVSSEEGKQQAKGEHHPNSANLYPSKMVHINQLGTG